MLDLILSERGVSNSCRGLSSLPPKYRFCVDSTGREENRSQASLAPKWIFQDYRSGYESNGEVSQFSRGRTPTAPDPPEKPDHALISGSAAQLLEHKSAPTRLCAKGAHGPCGTGRTRG